MPAGGTSDRVPCQLGVQMRVDVDEAGGHHQSVGVDLAQCRPVDSSNLDNTVTLDGNVGGPGRDAGAVHDRATADDQIVSHGLLPPECPGPSVTDGSDRRPQARNRV